MKVFWMLLVVLVVAAGVVAVVSGRGHNTDPTERTAVAEPVAPAPAPPTITKSDPVPDASTVPGVPMDATDVPRPANRVAASPAEPVAKPAPAPVKAPKLDELLDIKPVVKPEPAAPAVKPKVEPASAPKPAPAATPAAAAAPAKPADGELVVIPENPKFPDAKLVKAKVVRKRDGSLFIDDQYRVTGSGTEADPYKVPWDMMVSVKDNYNPQLGLNRLPQRVVMFDGKVLKITGFTAFPISAQSPKEMLVMLNQWDGCCIGVPPTAYDAIEVRLAKPGTPDDKLNNHGSVTGKFQVDPYESNGWLMGLYLMNDAHAEYDE